MRRGPFVQFRRNLWALVGAGAIAACGASGGTPTLNPPAQPQPSPALQSHLVQPDAGASRATETRHLSLIQGSRLAMNDQTRARLERDRFAIGDTRFATFGQGYVTLYAEDLPLYVSADSILDAMHRSYDSIVATIEAFQLQRDLDIFIFELRKRLAAGRARAHGRDAEADVDFYLAVAQSLLHGIEVKPVAGADAKSIKSVFEAARAAKGVPLTLFGRQRDEDFSQFTPRGHYVKYGIQRYFQAMMWFGRVDIRLTRLDERTGKVVLDPRQVRAMLALDAILDGPNRARWQRMDRIIYGFLGERDSMSFDQLPELLADFRAARSAAGGANTSDRAWLSAIEKGGYGRQRIASHLRFNSQGNATLPLAAAFSPFGQRFVVDSEALSKLSYDQLLPPAGKEQRLMPSPLDVGYAALGNRTAKQLLAEGIAKFGYARELEDMHAENERRGEAFWSSNLYNLWFSALRALSPGTEAEDGLPEVAKTEKWQLRLLNTQLSSWAELRHDTILYAKQSYSSGIMCEFPDAYVDPYPEAFSAIERYGRFGRNLAQLLDEGGIALLRKRVEGYFTHLETVAGMLRGMAERQRRGQEFSEDQMKFINETVKIRDGAMCGQSDSLTGWYGRLFFDPGQALEFEPTIADVHTQPTDRAGNMVGHVLHVGTGAPRLLYVTVETCKGPSTYVGLASTYYEKITHGFKRLTDKEWETMVNSEAPPAWFRNQLLE